MNQSIRKTLHENMEERNDEQDTGFQYLGLLNKLLYMKVNRIIK